MATADDLGVDVGCVSDIGRTLGTVSGLTNLAHALARRLSTPRGGLFYDPDYGLDLREWINEGLTDSGIVELGSLIEAEVRKDDRAREATATASYNRATRALTVDMSIDTVEGPFRMILAVDEIAVSLLNAGLPPLDIGGPPAAAASPLILAPPPAAPAPSVNAGLGAGSIAIGASGTLTDSVGFTFTSFSMPTYDGAAITLTFSHAVDPASISLGFSGTSILVAKTPGSIDPPIGYFVLDFVTGNQVQISFTSVVGNPAVTAYLYTLTVMSLVQRNSDSASCSNAPQTSTQYPVPELADDG